MSIQNAYDAIRPRPCGREATAVGYIDGVEVRVCKTHAASLEREAVRALQLQKDMFLFVEELIARVETQHMLGIHPWSWEKARDRIRELLDSNPPPS